MKSFSLLFFALASLFAHAQLSQPQPLVLRFYPDLFIDVDLDGDLDMVDLIMGTWAEQDADGSVLHTHQYTYNETGGLADLDNDGDMDGYGYETSTGYFGWFENQGNQELWPFEAVDDIPFADLFWVSSMVAFDMNMDGLQDLITPTESGEYSAYYNLGGGQFSDAQSLTFPNLGELLGGFNFYYLFDVDNDGFLDFIISQCADSPGGCTDGHYTDFYLSSQNYTLTSTNTIVNEFFTVADLNNDGISDLINTNFTDNSIYVVFDPLNSGFENEIELCCIETNGNWQMTDINQDGAADIIGSMQGEVWSYVNDGTGNFNNTPIQFNMPLYFMQANGLRFVDFDEDNDLDAFAAKSYFENTGNAQFEYLRHYEIPGNSSEYLKDIDADGLPEWIGTGENVVHLDPLSGVSHIDYDAFNLGAEFSSVYSSFQFLIDVNNDNVLEFFDFTESTVNAYSYTGDGFVLSNSSSIDFSSFVLKTDEFDFNGDGIIDPVFRDFSDPLSLFVVYLFEDMHAEGPIELGSFSQNATGSIPIDIDLDGDIDFTHNNENNYLMNDGNNNFILTPVENTNLLSFISPAEPDINGDGFSDSFDGLTFLEGNGYGLPFITHSFPNMIEGQIYWMDYNSDGLPDFFTHATVGDFPSYANTIQFYVNQGNFDFAEVQPVEFTSQFFLSFSQAMDMDNDDDEDLFFTAWYNNAESDYKGLFWSENTGAGSSILSGHIFYDENNDGLWTADETGIEMTPVSIDPPGNIQFTDDVFIRLVENGSYTVSVGYDEDIWTPTTPSSYTVEVTDGNSVITNLNFGFAPVSNSPVADVTVMAFPSVCSGIQQYSIEVHNYTELNADVLVTFTYDPLLVYSSSSQLEYQILDGQIQWLLTNVPYGTSQIIQAYMTYPDAGFIGSELISTVDACVVDASMNSLACDQEVWTEITSCAYDPNDIAVNPAGYTESGFILNGTELEYRIRFQNTGNAPALNVVVEDQLSENLDWSTLTPVAWSHPLRIEVSENGLAQFIFEDIMLPDSVSDEPNSHGFVRFRISPLANLSGTTEIHSSASIFFDLNEAVETNEVLNTIFTCDMMGVIESIEYECGINDITYDPGLQYVESFAWTVNNVAVGNEPILNLPFTTPTNLDVQLVVMNPLCETSFDFTLNLDNQIQNLTIAQNGSVLQCPVNNYWQYEWTLDGVLIEGETGASLDMTSYGSGHYAVNVSNNNGCSATYEGDFITEISEVKSRRDFSLFPNPSSNQVYFKSESQTIVRIAAYSADGLKLIDNAANSTSGVMDVSSLAPGIYYVAITAGSGEIHYQSLCIAH